MRRILLIKAAYNDPNIKTLTQPLGIMSLSAFLKNKSNDYKIRLFDNRFYADNEELKRVIQEFSPDIVGISCITYEALNMHSIASLVKAKDRNIIVIVGGPHPTQFFDEVLQDKNIDYVIRGEGEEAFFTLIEKLKNREEFENIEGVAFKKGEKIIDGGRAIIKTELNDLPMPDYDSIELERYFEHLSMATLGKRRYVTLSTSRGCPYQCIYCHNIFGRKFRTIEPDRVIKEIDYLVNKYKITDIEFVDDIFNLDKKRAEKILDMLSGRDYKLKLAFPNGLRSDLLDREILLKFKKAGTVFISFAIETASTNQQRRIKKRLNLQKVEEAIKIASHLDIICNGFFMLGLPGETKEEMEATINFALKSKLHTAYFFIVNPFKGTELYENNKELIKRREFQYDKYDYIYGSINVSDIPTKELIKMHSSAYVAFYFNPNRILKILYVYLKNGIDIKCLFSHGFGVLRLVIKKSMQSLFKKDKN